MHPFLNLIGFFALTFTVIVLMIFFVRLIFYVMKRSRFPRKTFAATLIGAVTFTGIFVYIQYFFTFDAINRADLQEGIEVSSPSGAYTANAYYEPYGGAAGGVNVWVEVTNHVENTTKIIYYADAKMNIHMSWVDDETLSITNTGGGAKSNRNIVLNVEKEIYHENGLACQSLLMKKDFEACYQYESK